MFRRAAPSDIESPEGDRHDALSVRWRLPVLRVLVLLATMAGVLLSLPLWGWGERTFPYAPPLPFLPALPRRVEVILLAVLLASCVAGIIFLRARWPLLVFLVTAFTFCLFDQMRWQPWVYQYLVMIACLAVVPARKKTETDATGSNSANRIENTIFISSALVMAFTYLWSGLRKFNETFFLDVFPLVFQPFLNLFPLDARESVVAIGGYVAAFAETGIGVALFFPRVRNVAVIALAAQHLVLLYCLGPMGINYNSVVWPWNVAMVLFAVAIFWNNKTMDARHMLLPRTRAQVAVLCLFGVLPILSFFGRWDSYLSAALYSGDTVWGKLEITDTARGRLPRSLDRHLITVGYNGVMDVNKWAVGDTGVTVYPEPRVFHQMLAEVCRRHARRDDDVVLTLYERPPPTTRLRVQTRLTCADVRHAEATAKSARDTISQP